MIPDRIGDSSHSSAMLIADGAHSRGARRNSPLERTIRIAYNQEHPHGAASQRLRALVLPGFAGHLEFTTAEG